VLVRRVRLILTNQRPKQGLHSLAAPRSRLLSTNPSTKSLQEQNPSADVVQANTIHLVTLFIDWSSRHPFSCVKNIPRHGRNVTTKHTFSKQDYDWSPFSTVSSNFIIEGSGSPCRAAVSDLEEFHCCNNDNDYHPTAGPGKVNVHVKRAVEGGPILVHLPR
jgi:hypothetical protein